MQESFSDEDLRSQAQQSAFVRAAWSTQSSKSPSRHRRLVSSSSLPDSNASERVPSRDQPRQSAPATLKERSRSDNDPRLSTSSANKHMGDKTNEVVGARSRHESTMFIDEGYVCTSLSPHFSSSLQHDCDEVRPSTTSSMPNLCCSCAVTSTAADT